MQKLLIILGVILVIIGVLWPWLSTLPIGRLPGDLVIKRDNFTFYFPITTMILISMFLSAILWFFRN